MYINTSLILGKTAAQNKLILQDFRGDTTPPIFGLGKSNRYTVYEN